MPESSMIEAICEKLAKGESMRTICAAQGFPNRRTLERWMADDRELAATIARAREIGFDHRAELAVEAAKGAEDPSKGRLAFDAERWYLSKLYAKKYGDSTTLKHADADGEKLPIDDVSRATRLASIFASIEKRQADDGAN